MNETMDVGTHTSLRRVLSGVVSKNGDDVRARMRRRRQSTILANDERDANY